MFESKEELLEKIRLGEDSLIEFKAVRFAGDKIRGPARDDLADELAAFANTGDGVLLLGVDDKTREVEGIAVGKLDAVESLVREVCNDAVTPPLVVRIVRMMLPDAAGVERALVKLDISRSLFVHRSPGGYLHRVGSSKRAMLPDYLARLFQQRSQTRLIRFEEQVIAAATWCPCSGSDSARRAPRMTAKSSCPSRGWPAGTRTGGGAPRWPVCSWHHGIHDAGFPTPSSRPWPMRARPRFPTRQMRSISSTPGTSQERWTSRLSRRAGSSSAILV